MTEPSLWNFEVQYREGSDAFDPELVCLLCDEALCSVEHEDPLATLVRMASDHACGQAGTESR